MTLTSCYFGFKPECSENGEDSLFNEIKYGVHFSYENIDFLNDDSSLEILEYDTSISEKVCHKNAKQITPLDALHHYISTSCISSPKIEPKTDVKTAYCKVTFP